MGVIVVAASPLWGSSDERAHVSYVQVLVDHHRLPVLGRDCVTSDLAVIGRAGERPSAGTDCRHEFLAASYEAFQPPLAYLLYAPVYALPVGLHAKAYLLRAETLFLLLGTVALVLTFVWREFPDRKYPVAAASLVFFLLPVVVVRNGNTTNGTLEMLVATAFAISAWRAWETGRNRPLLVAGVLLGLSMLTKLTAAYLAVPYVLTAVAVGRRRRDRRTIVAAIAGGLCAIALLAPWLAFNRSHYGTWTANERAQTMQGPYVNPSGYHYGVGDLPALNLSLANPLPEEWGPAIRPDENGTIPYNTRARLTLGAVAIGVLGLTLALGLRGRYWWFLSLLALDVAVMNATLLYDQWNIFVPRYLFSAGPAVAIAIGLALTTRFAERRTLLITAVMSAAFVCLFIWKAAAFYRLM